jgi:hypothetical protein
MKIQFYPILVLMFVLPGCMKVDPPLLPVHLENGLIDKTEREMAIKVELSPRIPILGENKVLISLKDSAGIPIEDAHLNLSASSTLPGMRIERVEINHGPIGVYETRLHYMTVGQWKMTLAIHRFGRKEIKEIFLFDVIGHS